MEQGQPARADLSCLYRRTQCAIGLAVVAAVAEAAVPEPRPELDEGVREFGRVQVVQPEFLYAGRVNDVAGAVEVVEAGVGGGMAS